MDCHRRCDHRDRLVLGAGVAFVLDARRQASGSLDTDLSGVSLENSTTQTNGDRPRRLEAAPPDRAREGGSVLAAVRG